MKNKTKSKKNSLPETDKPENLIPVFRMIPRSSTSMLCRYVGNIRHDDKLHDEPMDLDINEPGKMLILFNISDYEITACSNHCNIIGSYLLSNTKIPVYYTTILYDKKFVSGYLFRVCLYFTLEDDVVKQLNDDPKKYINKVLHGKFTMEFESDDNFLSEYLEENKDDIENDVLSNLAVTSEGEIDIDIITEKIAEKFTSYRDYFQPEEITNINKKYILKKMVTICKDDRLYPLSQYCIKVRERERVERDCPDQDYKVPEKIINLKELRDNPETMDQRIDELLDNASDIDSD
jgi:hypothetical protein